LHQQGAELLRGGVGPPHQVPHRGAGGERQEQFVEDLTAVAL